MGFDTSLYRFTDVMTIGEPWAISMIPQPVFAVMMLYQKTDSQKEYHRNEQVTPFPDSIWYIQERDELTCGTVALLHAILNAPEGVRSAAIRPDSWLHSFYKDCPVAMHPKDKADVLEGDSMIKMLHNKAARKLENDRVARSTATKEWVREVAPILKHSITRPQVRSALKHQI